MKVDPGKLANLSKSLQNASCVMDIWDLQVLLLPKAHSFTQCSILGSCLILLYFSILIALLLFYFANHFAAFCIIFLSMKRSGKCTSEVVWFDCVPWWKKVGIRNQVKYNFQFHSIFKTAYIIINFHNIYQELLWKAKSIKLRNKLSAALAFSYCNSMYYLWGSV